MLPAPEVQRAVVARLTHLPEGLLRRWVGPEIRSPDGFVLDLQSQWLLRAEERVGRQDYAQVSLAEARRAMAVGIRIVGSRPRVRVDVREATLPVDGGTLRARIYAPPDRGPQMPAVVYLHGGGFTLGSIESHEGECQRMALEVPAVVVSIDYRLAPEHKFPIPVDDCVTAFRWVATHAHSFGIDRSRMAVAGDSAGGNLSAAVARETRGDVVRPKLQVLIYPCTDFTRSLPSHGYFREGFMLSKASLDWFEAQYLHDKSQQTDPRASPLLASDHGGLPPALVVTAGFDPLRDEGDAYARAMRAAGVRVEHRCYKSLFHGFFSMSHAVDAADVAYRDIVGALRREFLLH